MKIIDVKTTLLSLPDLGGIQDATIRHVAKGRSACFVHIITDSGLEGLSPSGGGRAGQTLIEGTFKELLIGQDPLNIEKIWDDLFWCVRGVGRKGLAFCALSAVDIALWDLKAKHFNVPLYQLLGPYTDSVPVYGSGGWTNFNLEELVAEQTGYVERGFKAVKMKVGKDFGKSEREDIQRLAAVREAVGDDIEIYIDANNGYYAKQAIYMGKAFEEYRVGWFEEPVLADDIEGLAAIAKAINIPVATGEHEYTKFGFKELICSRRGGYRSAGCRASGRNHGVDEGGSPRARLSIFRSRRTPTNSSTCTLTCATPNLKVVEYLGIAEASDKIVYKEWSEPKDGMWSPDPNKPGLGLELNSEAVEKYAAGVDIPRGQL